MTAAVIPFPDLREHRNRAREMMAAARFLPADNITSFSASFATEEKMRDFYVRLHMGFLEPAGQFPTDSEPG